MRIPGWTRGTKDGGPKGGLPASKGPMIGQVYSGGGTSPSGVNTNHPCDRGCGDTVHHEAQDDHNADYHLY